jgi:hypothetical protein
MNEGVQVPLSQKGMTSEYVVLVACDPVPKYPALRDRKAGQGLISLTPHILRDNLQDQFVDSFSFLPRTHLTPYNETTRRPPGFISAASFQQDSLLLEEGAEAPWLRKHVWKISRRQQSTVAYETTCSHLFQPVYRQFHSKPHLSLPVTHPRIHLIDGSYEGADWAAGLHIPSASPKSALAPLCMQPGCSNLTEQSIQDGCAAVAA